MVMADIPTEPKTSLAAVREKIEKARQRLSVLNKKMDGYDAANPNQTDSPESKGMESAYAPARAEFDRLQNTEREQAADPTQADGSSTLAEVSDAQDKIRERLEILNRRADSTDVRRMGDASPAGKMLNSEIDYLNTEYQRLDGLRRQKGDAVEAAQQAAREKAGAVPSVQQLPPTTAKSAPSSPPNPPGSTTTAPMEDEPAAGGPAAEPLSTSSSSAKIDFVDATFYISLALLLDIICLVPIAGSILSVICIMGFGLWFYIKGLTDPVMRFGMVITGSAEIVPVVSSVLPGITAYVTLVVGRALLDEHLKRVAPIAETIAKSGIAPPQMRAGAAAIAAAAKTAETPKTSAVNTSSSAGGAGATTGTGSGSDSASAFSASTSGTQSGRSQSFGATMDAGSAGQAGTTPGEAAGASFDFKSETPYATGSPLATGSPYAGGAAGAERQQAKTASIGRELKNQQAKKEERGAQLTSEREKGNYEAADALLQQQRSADDAIRRLQAKHRSASDQQKNA
jgi:hypothetical protein